MHFLFLFFLSFGFVCNAFALSSSISMGYRYDNLLCKLDVNQSIYDNIVYKGSTHLQSLYFEGKLEEQFQIINCSLVGGIGPILDQNPSSVNFYGADPDVAFRSLNNSFNASGIIYSAAFEAQLFITRYRDYSLFLESGFSIEGLRDNTKNEHLLRIDGNPAKAEDVVHFNRHESINWFGPLLGIKGLYNAFPWSIGLNGDAILPIFFGSKKAFIEQHFNDQFYEQINYALNIKPYESWGYRLNFSLFYQINGCCSIGTQLHWQSLKQMNHWSHSSQTLQFFSPSNRLLGVSEHPRPGNFHLHWNTLECLICFLIAI
jgi:hypothetical protein